MRILDLNNHSAMLTSILSESDAIVNQDRHMDVFLFTHVIQKDASRNIPQENSNYISKLLCAIQPSQWLGSLSFAKRKEKASHRRPVSLVNLLAGCNRSSRLLLPSRDHIGYDHLHMQVKCQVRC